jgi:hypothetical protein
MDFRPVKVYQLMLWKLMKNRAAKILFEQYFSFISGLSFKLNHNL